MNKDLTPYDEAYYRVSFETAKLLKQAGFDVPTLTYYDGSDCHATQATDAFDYKNYNRHKGSTFHSAPLIDVAAEWLRDKGYKWRTHTGGLIVCNGSNVANVSRAIEKIIDNPDYEKNINLLFISTCCNHIIETQNKQ